MKTKTNLPEKADLSSMDMSHDNRKKLKVLFPSVFTEIKDENGEVVESIDFEKLKAELGTFSDVFENRRERYGMDWPGKRDCLKIIQQPSVATLKPCREESVNFDTTENLFIEGDNLEVLKLLQKSYYGKIKMIYIDPPYNTGKEFIYPDKYSESLDTYLAYAGLVDDEGKKFSTNTESEGRFHTKWMNMMYPRLYLARNLLNEKGIIFISISDNELVNLRKICDEIFGEDNFISSIIIQSNKRGQTYNDISKTHEYLLIYSKTSLSQVYELEKDSAALPFQDSEGKYDLWELRNRNPKFGRHNRPNLFYPIYIAPNIIDESGYSKLSLTPSEEFCEKVYPKNSEGIDGCWRWSKDKINSTDLQSGNPVLIGKKKRDGGWNVYEKARKNTTKVKSIWSETSVISEQGTVTLGMLGLSGVFDHPKPVGLLEKILEISTEKEDIVLDFFSGSCTTAHAVIKHNVEKQKNLKFIMVQLPELCDKSSGAYKTGFRRIADIGKDRIRKVIEMHIQQENHNMDFGFKVFKLARSNIKIWDGSKGENSESSLVNQLEFNIDHIDVGSTTEDVLYELLLKSGFEITDNISEIEILGAKIFSVSDGALLICLEHRIDLNLIESVADLEPIQFICLDKAFNGNDQLKANAVQTFAARNQGKTKAQQINFRTV